MGLCKGSRLTGWADLDSQPVGACAVDGVTSRALANQGRGCVASSGAADTQDDITFHTNSHHNTQLFYGSLEGPAFTQNKKQIFSGAVKESEPVFVFAPVSMKMGYAKLKGKRISSLN